MRGIGISRDPLRACAHPGSVRALIIHHPSSIIHPPAFTLIELLVVISIIALLMAIFMPCLRRVHRQAMSMGCQAKLRQWGTFFQTEATARVDGAITYELQYVFHEAALDDPNGGDRDALRDRHMIPPDLYVCPMASRLGRTQRWEWEQPWGDGGTFFADWWTRPDGRIEARSYTTNGAVWYTIQREGKLFKGWVEYRDPRGKPLPYASIPVVFDAGRAGSLGDHLLPPPPYEEDALRSAGSPYSPWVSLCINRHDGGVNYLFLDWSVRKVGLKELWTLNWHPAFDTRGPWTKAGGVKPRTGHNGCGGSKITEAGYS